MAALDNNGIYKDFNHGSIEFDKSVSSDDLTDFELKVYDTIIDSILSNLIHNQPINTITLSRTIKDQAGDYNVRINKDIIISSVLAGLNDTGNGGFQLVVLNKNSRDQVRQALNKALNQIQLEIYALNGLAAVSRNESDATQNYILNNIIALYNNPKTLASTSPTTMEPVKEVAETLGLNKANRNHLNPASDIYINKSNFVGKVDIGISAVAQKAFYAITYANGTKSENGESILNTRTIQKPIELPSDWIFDRAAIYSLGFAGSKINQATIDELVELSTPSKDKDTPSNFRLAGEDGTRSLRYNPEANLYVLVENQDGQQFVYVGSPAANIAYDENGNYIGSTMPIKAYTLENINELKPNLKLMRVGDNVADLVSTTINSSFISAATDNAKVMLLDLLNASPEVLPAYEYLLSLGVNLIQAAKILTDPMVTKLVDACRGNLFRNKSAIGRMTNVLSKSDQTLLAIVTGEAEEKIAVNAEKYTPIKNKLRILKRIFDGAQELTSIGIALGINGGINVQLGDPLMYQLNLERSVNIAAKDQKNNFSLVKFLQDDEYAQAWINLLDSRAEGYNMLDILHTVPHYRAMLKVPVLFKNIVQTESKDVDNAYTWIYQNGKHHYKIDEPTVRQVIRVFNDRKIFDFFRDVPFVYETPTVLENRVNNGQLQHNRFTKERKNEPVELSTATAIGLATLKSHIEDDIIPIIKTKYLDNAFVQNIVHNMSYNSLFGEKFGAYASRINLGDPQLEDTLAGIKSDFYRIKDDVIDGHTVFEWMFLYDLLCYKHNISRNSFSAVFDNSIDLADNNNIMTKWLDYVNRYDSSPQVMSKLTELNAIPTLRPIKSSGDNVAEAYGEALHTEVEDHRRSRPDWATDPNILPLFVKIADFDNQTFVNSNLLSKAFSKGIIAVNLC